MRSIASVADQELAITNGRDQDRVEDRYDRTVSREERRRMMKSTIAIGIVQQNKEGIETQKVRWHKMNPLNRNR